MSKGYGTVVPSVRVPEGKPAGCEKYHEAKYRASGMWPVNWSRERVQRASGETPEGGT